MTIETNKQVVQQFYQMVDQGDTSKVADLFSPTWVNVDPALPPLQGLEGAKALIKLLKDGFPDFNSKIELMAAEGDRVAVRVSHTGTQLGEFLGIPATGKAAQITSTGIYTIRAGKLVENRVIFDAFGLLQQLGVVPQ